MDRKEKKLSTRRHQYFADRTKSKQQNTRMTKKKGWIGTRLGRFGAPSRVLLLAKTAIFIHRSFPHRSSRFGGAAPAEVPFACASFYFDLPPALHGCHTRSGKCRVGRGARAQSTPCVLCPLLPIKPTSEWMAWVGSGRARVLFVCKSYRHSARVWRACKSLRRSFRRGANQ